MWRDLSTTAVLDTAVGSVHGRQPRPQGDPAGRGLRDRASTATARSPSSRCSTPTATTSPPTPVTSSRRSSTTPRTPGSTFNLFQEMSLGQLYPEGTVPSAGIDGRGFDYEPGFDFTNAEAGQTCTGATLEDAPVAAEGTPALPRADQQRRLQPARQHRLLRLRRATAPRSSAPLAGVGALQSIDSGCGSPGKLVYDAAVIADPEIDYSDFDTDKDGVVDFFMAVFAGCGGNGVLPAQRRRLRLRRRARTTTSGRTPRRWSSTTPTRRPACPATPPTTS